MRSSVFAAGITLLASWACAAPAPQDIDFDLADSIPNPTYTTTLSSVTYDPTAILQSALPQITSQATNDTDAAPTDVSSIDALAKRSACAPQPTGAGPIPSPDSASAFAVLPAFSSAAVNAPVPSGYSQTFTNLNASNNAYGYMGYTTLSTYNVAACAAKCNAINGCMSINIFYERDPSVDPGTSAGSSGCPNPPSTTNIKCVFWGGPVTPDNALNFGQWRNQFQVVIAGSNGYVNNSIADPTGYTGALDLGNAAVNAPYDEYGYDSYINAAMFNSGPFDASLCAKACSTQNAYAYAHPPSDGSPVKACHFFNTYIMYINTTKNLQGQYCAMYSESWPSSKYATNVGQYRGSDHYLIEYSYAWSNSTSPGAASPDAAVHQASKDISYSTLQPFCSSYLGFATPVVTSTATATVTNVVTSTITTVVGTITSTITTSAARASSALAKRLIVVSAAAPSTPAVLTKYPSAILSSACSLQATPIPVTSTSVISSTVTTLTTTTTQFSSTTTTTTTTTAQASPAAACAFGQGLGHFNIQSGSNLLFGSLSNNGVNFNAPSANSGSVFSLDANCVLTVAYGNSVLSAYQTAQLGGSISFGSSSTISANNYNTATCTVDATTYDITCSVNGNSVHAFYYYNSWFLYPTAELAEAHQLTAPITLKAVPILDCTFGQSMGPFKIQSSFRSLFGQYNYGNLQFTSSSSNAQIFTLDQNCVLTSTTQGSTLQAYQDSYGLAGAGEVISFRTPAAIKQMSGTPVTCTVDASYYLACSVQGNGVNAYDLYEYWYLEESVDIADRAGLATPLSLTAVRVATCPYGQGLGTFAIQDSVDQDFVTQSGDYLRFAAGSPSSARSNAQLFTLDENCVLTEAASGQKVYIEAGTNGSGVPVVADSIQDALASQYLPLTCTVDTSNTLVCTSQDNSVSALSGGGAFSAGYWILFNSAADVQAQEDTVVSLTAVPYSPPN